MLQYVMYVFMNYIKDFTERIVGNQKDIYSKTFKNNIHKISSSDKFIAAEVPIKILVIETAVKLLLFKLKYIIRLRSKSNVIYILVQTQIY